MTQEQKDLLIKDLCGRLPYGVKVRYSSYKEFITCTLHSINPIYNNIDLWSKNACFTSVSISKIKPYLFPLSSMTEEQEEELKELLGDSVTFSKYNEWFYDMDGYSRIYLSNVQTAIDWFNKNHFDYRGLVEENLAIDATGLNIY